MSGSAGTLHHLYFYQISHRLVKNNLCDYTSQRTFSINSLTANSIFPLAIYEGTYIQNRHPLQLHSARVNNSFYFEPKKMKKIWPNHKHIPCLPAYQLHPNHIRFLMASDCLSITIYGILPNFSAWSHIDGATVKMGLLKKSVFNTVMVYFALY